MSTPNRRWPLHLHEAVGNVEKRTRALLLDCFNDGYFGMAVDVVQVTQIMRASAAESFKARVEYYECQPGFCRERLDEIADETVTATLGLVPLFVVGSRYRAAVPAIREQLKAELQTAFKLRAETAARLSAGSTQVYELEVFGTARQEAPGQGPKRQESLPAPRQPGAVSSWDEIEIRFLSDHRIEVKLGASIETYNYHEIGFADRRAKEGTPKPNEAWTTLRALAEADGVAPIAAPALLKIAGQVRDPEGEQLASRKARGRRLAKFEKRIQEIRRALRKHFRISGDPVPFTKRVGYKTRFKISCAPSFNS